MVNIIKKVSSALVKVGIKQGDVVSMFSYNTAEWILMFWSFVWSGAIVTTVNPAYTKCKDTPRYLQNRNKMDKQKFK